MSDTTSPDRFRLALPAHAERLRLPDGSTIHDAIVWPHFMQDELRLDPAEIWAELLALPTWPDSDPIPFRASGGNPHWITGAHQALRMRGHELRRDKIWCQSDYAEGLRRYRYTGWQHAISFATHAVEHVRPVERVACLLNPWLSGAMMASATDGTLHNHWIVTRYVDREYSIGFHSDKSDDFAPGSWFVVLKLGAARDFAFRVPGEKGPFWRRALDAGTAVFVRCNASGCANALVQHGVPPMARDVGVSGSIVSRCITTVVPWERVRREVEKRLVRA